MCVRAHGWTRARLAVKSHYSTHTHTAARPGPDRRKFAGTHLSPRTCLMCVHRCTTCDVHVSIDVHSVLFHTRVTVQFHTSPRVSLICAPLPAECVTRCTLPRRARCVPAQRIRTVRSYKGPQRGTVEAISVYTKSRRVYLGEGRAHGFTARPVINTNYLKPRSHRG